MGQQWRTVWTGALAAEVLGGAPWQVSPLGGQLTPTTERPHYAENTREGRDLQKLNPKQLRKR